MRVKGGDQSYHAVYPAGKWKGLRSGVVKSPLQTNKTRFSLDALALKPFDFHIFGETVSGYTGRLPVQPE